MFLSCNRIHEKWINQKNVRLGFTWVLMVFRFWLNHGSSACHQVAALSLFSLSKHLRLHVNKHLPAS